MKSLFFTFLDHCFNIGLFPRSASRFNFFQSVLDAVLWISVEHGMIWGQPSDSTVYWEERHIDQYNITIGYTAYDGTPFSSV